MKNLLLCLFMLPLFCAERPSEVPSASTDQRRAIEDTIRALARLRYTLWHKEYIAPSPEHPRGRVKMQKFTFCDCALM